MNSSPQGHLFIIGAQRSATTQLVQQLDSHPSISMAVPQHPEPKWFLKPDGNNDIDAYLRMHFPRDTTNLWLGEKSTSYLENPEVAKRININIDNPHIFVILRDPIERAISNFHYSVMNGAEMRTLEEALEPGGTGSTPLWDEANFSASPFAYLERGLYSQLLMPWLDIFGEDLHILMFEEVVQGYGARRVASYLGLSGWEFEVPKTPVNSAPRNGPKPTCGLRKSLREFFEGPNRELSNTFDIENTHWCN